MLDPLLEDRFSALRNISARDPQASRFGKEKFLAQALKFKQAVPNSKDQRHYGWIDSIRNTFNIKERSPMLVPIASILLAAILLFGGSGAAVYAAQDSLPNDPLYEIKILNEQLLLNLPNNEDKILRLDLDFASRRVEEIASMAVLGESSPEPVLQRLENHLDQALSQAASANQENLQAVMSQIQERLREQLKILEQAPQDDPIMAQARTALQIRLHWAELGLSEPLAFQAQARSRNRFNQSPESSPPGIGSQGLQEPEGNEYGPGPNEQSGPNESGYGPAPGYEQEPSQGGFGPGPNDQQDPNQGGYGPGPNSQQDPNQGSYGPGPDNAPGSDDSSSSSDPDAEAEPAGAGYGPGPGPEVPCTANCDPACPSSGSDSSDYPKQDRDTDRERSGKP